MVPYGERRKILKLIVKQREKKRNFRLGDNALAVRHTKEENFGVFSKEKFYFILFFEFYNHIVNVVSKVSRD